MSAAVVSECILRLAVNWDLVALLFCCVFYRVTWRLKGCLFPDTDFVGKNQSACLIVAGMG